MVTLFNGDELCFDIREYNEKVNNRVLFTQEDVNKCSHPLLKVLRKIIHEEQITLRDFIERHDEYMKSINASQRERNYKKNNILKVLLKQEEITWKLFSYIVSNVLKSNVKSITIEFVDIAGNIKSVTQKCTI